MDKVKVPLDKVKVPLILDMNEVNEQIEKILELRKELILAVQQLGGTVKGAVLQLKTPELLWQPTDSCYIDLSGSHGKEDKEHGKV